MRSVLWLAAACTLAITACKADENVTYGVRADGVTVTCANNSGQTEACTPNDGDTACEAWEDGGTAFVLWPPNHKLHRFTVDSCIRARDCLPDPPDYPETDPSDGMGDGMDDMDDMDDDMDEQTDEHLTIVRAMTPVRITRITSDEAVDVGAGGDGSTSEYDVSIIDDATFELRAERQGGSDGRVYRVHYTDAGGRSDSCELMVPHDRGPHGGAVDSGDVVTVNR